MFDMEQSHRIDETITISTDEELPVNASTNSMYSLYPAILPQSQDSGFYAFTGYRISIPA